MRIWVNNKEHKITRLSNLVSLLQQHPQEKKQIAEQFLAGYLPDLINYAVYDRDEYNKIASEMLINLLEILPEYRLALLKKFTTNITYLKCFALYWPQFESYFHPHQAALLPHIWLTTNYNYACSILPKMFTKEGKSYHAVYCEYLLQSPENLISKLRAHCFMALAANPAYYQRICELLLAINADPKLQAKFCDALYFTSSEYVYLKGRFGAKLFHILLRYPHHLWELGGLVPRNDVINAVTANPGLIAKLSVERRSIQGYLSSYPELNAIFIAYNKQDVNLFCSIINHYPRNAYAKQDFDLFVQDYPDLTLQLITAALLSNYRYFFSQDESFKTRLKNFDNPQAKKAMLEHFFTLEIKSRIFGSERLFATLNLFLQAFDTKQETQLVLEEFLIERLTNNTFFIVKDIDRLDIQKLPETTQQKIAPLIGENPSCWQYFSYCNIIDPLKYMSKLQTTYPKLADVFAYRLQVGAKQLSMCDLADVTQLLKTYPQHKKLIAHLLTHDSNRYVAKTVEQLDTLLVLFKDIEGFEEKIKDLLGNTLNHPLFAFIQYKQTTSPSIAQALIENSVLFTRLPPGEAMEIDDQSKHTLGY